VYFCMLRHQHGPFVLQGDRHTAIYGGATVHLSARVDDAVWHQALGAIAVTAAAHAAHAAESEARRQLRVAEQQMDSPAASEETAAALQRAAAAQQLDGALAPAAAQPEPSPPQQAAVQQHLTAINAQELDAALRLHGQVGNSAVASAVVRHSAQPGRS
jgi:sRNA-binding protein